MTYRDKAFHFCGAFTLTMIGMAWLGIWWGAILVAIGSILLEIYQWKYEMYYPSKKVDTIVDLICNAAGIYWAIWIWIGIAP